tara:strand:+ start:737 stop:1837 length:1101 start_codon:yes stop_codon:yes gene_type:complete
MYLILTQCFPSRTGGIESLLSNLSLGLAEKNKVIVFADRHHLFYDAIFDNANKKKLIVRRTGGIKFFRRRKKSKEIKFFIESSKVELVIADTWKSLELTIDFINNKNVPVVCLAHGNELISKNNDKLARIKRTLDKVNLIIANSKYTIDLLNKLKLDQNNFKYVYPGALDLRQYKSDNFIDITGKPVLLTLARLEKRKGHIEILKVVKKLKLKFNNIQYIIAGDGPEKSYLKNLVKKYELESNVFFVGMINEFQKKYLFENTDLMIMPTLDEIEKRSIEGFGIAYLEAAFFGIPSIASNVGGTPEAVLHNKTGMIIENFDQLYQSSYDLLIKPDLRNQLGKQAKERAIKEFNWEVVTKNYLSAIDI